MIRCDRGMFIFVGVLALLVLAFYVHQGNIVIHGYLPYGNNKDHPVVSTAVVDHSSRLRRPINITFTTGASSREFLNLLRLVESLIELKSNPLLVVWDLGLRVCQVRFLLKTLQPQGIQLLVKEFPFTFYPLYFRSIEEIWKPVAIQKVVDEFGTALWLDPQLELNKHFTDIFAAFERNGFVAASSSVDIRHNSTCSSSLVGCQRGNENAYNILKEWSQLTLQVVISNCRYSSTIVKASCGKGTVNWADHMLSFLLSQSKESCQYLVSQEVHTHDTPLQKHFLSKQDSICPIKSVCILTGNQTYNMKDLRVASALRQNKEKYASTHGYHFIEEGRPYIERKNSGYSGANWGKMDSILNHLDDCRLLFFVDSDAIFTNFSIKVESFFALPEAKDKDMLIVKPSCNRFINTGVMLMRNTENIRALFLASMDQQSWNRDWRFRFGFEQSAMWGLVRPARSIWRHSVHVFEGDHTLQGLCGFSDGHCLWRPGDFIAHFAPPRLPEKRMERFMKEHSDIVHVKWKLRRKWAI